MATLLDLATVSQELAKPVHGPAHGPAGRRGKHPLHPALVKPVVGPERRRWALAKLVHRQARSQPQHQAVQTLHA